MPEDIEKLVRLFQSILHDLKGGHCNATFEYYVCLKNDYDDYYPSNIPWLNLETVYQTYQLPKTWRNISVQDIPDLITHRMKEAWMFQKKFNSTWASCFSTLDSEVSFIIENLRSTLKELLKNLVECRGEHLKLGANDYWILLLFSNNEVHVFEFLHFID